MSKKRKSSQQVCLTQGELNKIKREITEDTIQKVLVMVNGYLMDDFGYDADKIVEFNKGMERYVDAINDGVISLRGIADVVEQYTGIRFKGVNA